MGTKWYEKLFSNYAYSYDKNTYVEGTSGEVDFIEKEISMDKNKKILDIGCGTGRHSLELTRRGYNVVGFDLSEDQINRAKEKMNEENLDMNFFIKDARSFKFDSKFDLAIMLCEGGIGLMEKDEMDYQILKNIEQNLCDSGKLIMTVPNAIFQIRNNDQINLETFREDFDIEKVDDDGNKEIIKANQRYYTPSEIKWRLNSLGFENINIYDCELGNFKRKNNSDYNTFEILVIAEK